MRDQMPPVSEYHKTSTAPDVLTTYQSGQNPSSPYGAAAQRGMTPSSATMSVLVGTTCQDVGPSRVIVSGSTSMHDSAPSIVTAHAPLSHVLTNRTRSRGTGSG